MRYIKGALVSFVLFLSFTTQAATQIPYYGEEFYSNTNLKDESLRRLLHRILTEKHQQSPGKLDKMVSNCESGAKCYQHTGLSYNQAKAFLLSKYYLVQNGKGFVIRDVYCEENYPVPGPNAIPDANVLNIEHTWPQSRFTGKYNKNVQKADMHHLYPTDSQMNSIRGNYPFGEVERDQKTLKCNTSRYGIAKQGNQLVFEPPGEHKGNVARALFYFSVRYDLRMDEKQEAFLREWNKLDPVDNEELERNEEIFKAQGNRNPFVDMPELADQIQRF